jgi:hypothetical protein
MVLATLFSTGAGAMGEKYTEQAGRLRIAMLDMLVAKGFCRAHRECYDLLPTTGGHGDRVRYAFYEVGTNNIHAFMAIIEFVVRDGIRITGGVPITITGYREPFDKYRESGLFFKDVKPFLVLEVNK